MLCSVTTPIAGHHRQQTRSRSRARPPFYLPSLLFSYHRSSLVLHYPHPTSCFPLRAVFCSGSLLRHFHPRPLRQKENPTCPSAVYTHSP
ncbi:hypothetical protein BD779DRAFT_1531707 [Infundibulicybe gibba]|nr:hypothetical protein BD779DRAFT_1531707 [Infundibulicybe gibba]